uniref:Uncharacterized protein n=1 Tax=Oryza glumipatula TaxID=40148 RepID=A0A0E0AAJ1_9ORYZ
MVMAVTHLPLIPLPLLSLCLLNGGAAAADGGTAATGLGGGGRRGGRRGGRHGGRRSRGEVAAAADGGAAAVGPGGGGQCGGRCGGRCSHGEVTVAANGGRGGRPGYDTEAGACAARWARQRGGSSGDGGDWPGRGSGRWQPPDPATAVAVVVVEAGTSVVASGGCFLINKVAMPASILAKIKEEVAAWVKESR